MKRILFSIILTLGIFSAFAQKTPQEAEKMRFEAQVKADTSALKKVLSKKLIYVHSNALVQNRTDFLTSVASKSIVYQSITPIDKATIYTDKSYAFINGKVKVIGTIDGKPFETTLIYTSVYKKSKGKFKLIRWQSTKVS